MAKLKIKNPMPSVGEIFAAARVLLEIAYRILTNQIEGWKGHGPARILLDRIMESFKKFDEDFDKSNREAFDLMSLEGFVRIHKRSKEKKWSEEELRKQLFYAINGKDWGDEELNKTFSDHARFDENGKFIPDIEVPEEWIKLQHNPSKSTPQGVVEDAIYTWSTICGYGKGDTKLKELRRKGKRGAVKLNLLRDAMEWYRSGENEKFQDEVLRRLFGWDRKSFTEDIVKRCADEAIELGLDINKITIEEDTPRGVNF